MKRILIVSAASAIALNLASAQTPEPFFPSKAGTGLEYEMRDGATGKPLMFTRDSLSGFTGDFSKGGAVIVNTTRYADDTLTVRANEVMKFEDFEVIYDYAASMEESLGDMVRQSLSIAGAGEADLAEVDKMMEEVSMTGESRGIPAELAVGMTLPDYDVSVKVMFVTTKMNCKDRKVTARETVTTPAGSFDCFVVEEKTTVINRPVAEPPQVASVFEYRPRSVPTHIIHAEVLQSALLSESEELRQAAEKAQRKNAPKRRVRNKKLETPQQAEAPVPDADTGESIDDYTGPEDAKSISHELRGEMRELTLRMMITGVCTVLLVLVNLIFGGQITGPGDPGSLPVVYVVLTLVFLAVAVGVCYRTVLNGLKALFSFNANSDSAAAVASVAVIIQAVSAAFFQDALTDGTLHLYAVVLSAILFANAAGKLTMIRRIHSNFRFVTGREQKYSVRLYGDHNTALKMAKDCVAETPVIAYQCPTGFLKRFLELSYKPDPSESASQLMAPIGLIASLLLCIATLLITSSVPTAISAFAAASCACVAVSNMLSVNLPISRLCRTARRAGAMVVGYEGVEQMGNVNAVLVDAGELFPRGTVVLGGIKTFGGRALAEEAVMSASALMQKVGGPLSGVFDQVISENEDALPQVENFTYEDSAGIVGRVDGKTIYIGGRALLINHRISVPPREEESQYASGNQQVIYIAVESEAAAMLVLTYAADRRRKNELQRLEDSGISVIVRTTDPNVTTQLVSRLFGIDTASVGILDSRLGEEYQKLAQKEIPRADALVATKGRMESMMNVISACVEERRTVSMVVAIQNAAMVLGFVLVAFLACFGAMGQLTSLVLFLFQLFWVLVTLVLPKLRR